MPFFLLNPSVPLFKLQSYYILIFQEPLSSDTQKNRDVLRVPLTGPKLNLNHTEYLYSKPRRLAKPVKNPFGVQGGGQSPPKCCDVLWFETS
jgi:hypothetical protein